VGFRDEKMTRDFPAKSLAVRTLAAYEAPWLPIRNQFAKAGAICARRRGDVLLSVGGGREQQRALQVRQRDALAAAGLLVGRSLTPLGRRLVRSWTWPYQKSELRTALNRIVRAVARGDVLDDPTDAPAVPQELITGTAYDTPNWKRDVGMLTMLFLPLLADGVLISCSSPVGDVAYGFSDGRGGNIRRIVDEAIGDEEFNEELADAYSREFRRCRGEILADAGYYAELGELPYGGNGLKSGRDSIAPKGIRRLFPAEAAAADG
jgi:hypothetical protein